MLYSVPAVENAVKLLNYLKESGSDYASLAQACDAVRIPRSTGFNIMKTLEKHDFVEFDEDSKRYRLGHALIELGARASEHINVVEDIRPYLQALGRETGLTCTLAQRVGTHLVIISKVESVNDIAVTASLGHPYSLTTGAIGKIIMAYMSEDELKSLVLEPGLQPFTPHTITDRETLLQRLARAREMGYATSIEEFVPSVNSVAAPVFDVHGNVDLTIGILGLASYLPVAQIDTFGRKLLHVARQATEAIGGRWLITEQAESELQERGATG